MKNELWKEIDGYNGNFLVSNFGNVKSIDRWICKKDGTKEFKYGRLIKLQRRISGYIQVSLCYKCKSKTYNVHRLVAKAFLDNPHNLPEVNHKDENKANNNVENLEWCNREYNMNYGSLPSRMRENLGCTKRRSNKVAQISRSGVVIAIYNSAKEAQKTTDLIMQL